MEQINITSLHLDSPIDYSEFLAISHSGSQSRESKKDLGQFFTPKDLAIFMASIADVDIEKNSIRILDPGCGTLILASSLVEKLVSENVNIEEIIVDAYEIDTFLESDIAWLGEKLTLWGRERNINIIINHFKEDFILANRDYNIPIKNYDYIISNPPYFKIGKEDERLGVFNKPLKGQQNIYSLFMLLSSFLLNQGGQLIYLVPRSFTSGSYYQSFREQFLNNVSIKFIHLFSSRVAGFKKDNVLQENIIVKAINKNDSLDDLIQISQSNGLDDLNHNCLNVFREADLIRDLGSLLAIHVPVNSHEQTSIQLFYQWHDNLQTLGYKVSTGPVVPFRSREHLKEDTSCEYSCVPLFWMHNCRKMELTWPLKKRNKQEWIIDNLESKSKLVNNENFVILRRFSSKEEKAKIVAVPHLRDRFQYDKVGIENHLNYLYKIDGELTEFEVYGLSVLYNSSIFDSYFRSLNGNTQVNAKELNSIPMPSVEIIIRIGQEYLDSHNQCSNDLQRIELIDNIVNDIFVTQN
tara:strand:- start:17128 stop:18696 length:1569 start_codon:yes stop_codon:yes gene_type:complete